MDFRPMRLDATQHQTTNLGFETDIPALYHLDDPDTAIKKRNRQAQRSHRQKKRAVAAQEAASGVPTSENVRLPHDVLPNQSIIPGRRHGDPDESFPISPGWSNQDRTLTIGSRLQEHIATNAMPTGSRIPHPNDTEGGTQDRPGDTICRSLETPSELLNEYLDLGRMEEDPSQWCLHLKKSQGGSHATLSNNDFSQIDGVPAHFSSSLFPDCSVIDDRHTSSSARSSRVPPLESDSEDGLSERHFERILEAAESAGFHSFDEMAIAYYTSAFNGQSSQSTQRFSRERQLKLLLKALNQSAKGWSSREKWAYQEEVLDSAQDILSDELLRHGSSKYLNSSVASLSSDSRHNVDRSPIFEMFQRLLKDKEVNAAVRQEIRILREDVPDGWGLLERLGQNANLPPTMTTHVVAVFLHLLVRGNFEM